MLIFFFKQKTAYEMRISDWSSDVCSSDLGLTSVVQVASVPSISVPVVSTTLAPRMGKRASAIRWRVTAGPKSNSWFPSTMMPRDRQSVVLGKSVSVRVDLGGRRIIQKKQTSLYFHHDSYLIIITKY